jgi:hypothetical protein
MKKTLILMWLCSMIITCATAQYKKDGTPDMRYNANKQAYGNSYTTPAYNNVNPSTRYQTGYIKSNGAYVEPHMKTNINSTNHDNFSTSGNYNTYTGTAGSRARDYSNDAQNYGSGRVIQTGPQGGQYYYNSVGNKVYVPKR